MRSTSTRRLALCALVSGALSGEPLRPALKDNFLRTVRVRLGDADTASRPPGPAAGPQGGCMGCVGTPIVPAWAGPPLFNK